MVTRVLHCQLPHCNKLNVWRVFNGHRENEEAFHSLPRTQVILKRGDSLSLSPSPWASLFSSLASLRHSLICTQINFDTHSLSHSHLFPLSLTVSVSQLFTQYELSIRHKFNFICPLTLPTTGCITLWTHCKVIPLATNFLFQYNGHLSTPLSACLARSLSSLSVEFHIRHSKCPWHLQVDQVNFQHLRQSTVSVQAQGLTSCLYSCMCECLTLSLSKSSSMCTWWTIDTGDHFFSLSLSLSSSSSCGGGDS